MVGRSSAVPYQGTQSAHHGEHSPADLTTHEAPTGPQPGITPGRKPANHSQRRQFSLQGNGKQITRRPV